MTAQFGKSLAVSVLAVVVAAGLLPLNASQPPKSLAADDPPKASQHSGSSNPFAAVLATPTDPVLGYTGQSGFILVNAKTWAAGGFLNCGNILTGQREVVGTAFTLEGADFVNGLSGHTYLTNLDPAKYTAREIFLSSDPDWTGLYPTFCKTASGPWVQADSCNRALVAGTGTGATFRIKQRPAGY